MRSGLSAFRETVRNRSLSSNHTPDIMARSVARHSNAYRTIYFDVSDFDRWSFEERFLFPLIAAVQRRFPSFHDERAADEWPEDEVRRVAGNGHCIITASEYAGIASVCIVPKSYKDAFGWPQERRTALAGGWVGQHGDGVAEEIRDRFPGLALEKVATASNGEAAYRRAVAA